MATVTEKLHDGNTSAATTYSFPFQYIKLTDVKVEVLEGSPLAWVAKTKDTDYEFPTATTVKFKDTKTPPAGTDNVRIYRETDSSKLTGSFYPNAAIRSQDLNENFNQNLFLSQETENDSNSALSNSRELNTTTGAWTSAISVANTAKTTADTADTNATAAVSTANTASTNASNAVTTANTASTNATNAVSTANAADTIADNAKLATDRLVGTTSDGGSTWTVAGNNTDASTDPKGLGYAITTADTAKSTADTADTNASAAVTTANTASTNATNAVATANTASTNASNAVTTANAASAAVGNALLYTLKDNKTQFEAVTFDDSEAHEAWEITDSTGISSAYNTSGFTDNGGSGTAKTVTGVPSGFTGDSGLSARFTYVHSSNTFTWAGYWVNDAETRYVVLGPATGSAPQSSSTTAANLPSGTTAQRPGTPVSGMFRYNTTESEFEGYDGTEWGKVGGGLVTIDGGNFTLGTSLVHTTESYDGGSFN